MTGSRFPSWRVFGSSSTSNGAALRYVLLTLVLMIVLYSVLFQSHSPDSKFASALGAYLEGTARTSSWLLNLLGESSVVQRTTVYGRFPYIVVVDCAALDAQALFSAAVLAFPARLWTKAVGLVLGWLSIFALNTVRLAALYFAGSRSLELFRTLHEEVFVFVIIACVAGLFLAWASWAKRRPQLPDGGIARHAS